MERIYVERLPGRPGFVLGAESAEGGVVLPLSRSSARRLADVLRVETEKPDLAVGAEGQRHSFIPYSHIEDLPEWIPLVVVMELPIYSLTYRVMAIVRGKGPLAGNYLTLSQSHVMAIAKGAGFDLSVGTEIDLHRNALTPHLEWVANRLADGRPMQTGKMGPNVALTMENARVPS